MVKAKAKDEKVKNVLLHQSSVIGWILVIVDPEDASIRGNDVGKKDSARKEDKNCLINWKDNGYILATRPVQRTTQREKCSGVENK